MKLSIKKKRLLREFSDFTCESCKKKEDEVGTLEIHRLNRGYNNGEYSLRNIQVLCKKCHKQRHFKEFKQTGG